MRAEFEFSKNTLYINIEGTIDKTGIKKLKKRLYYIIEEYHICDIVINIESCHEVDKDVFYNFLDDYDIRYGGNLVVT
ncbi:MAG: hypothetical protein PHE54_04315 [Bacilli bacterium]|nr:hypothetical protein [Bacilli bacterium]